MLRPMLFNTQEVKMILAGQKMQTRMLVKRGGWMVQGLPTFQWVQGEHSIGEGVNFHVTNGRTMTTVNIKPPCEPGDVLWVRETWADIPGLSPGNLHYKASATEADLKWFREEGWKWRPSVHMPFEAARIFLRVTDVRVEQIQDITDSGVMAEGMVFREWLDYVERQREYAKGFGYIAVYETLRAFWGHRVWDKKLKNLWQVGHYGWDVNPYVWAITFERVEKP